MTNGKQTTTFSMSIFLVFLWFLQYVQLPVHAAIPYEFLILIQSWPPAFCGINFCARTGHKFVVHGVWPFNPGRQHFVGLTFVRELVISLLSTKKDAEFLDTVWPDLKIHKESASNVQTLWEHEWQSHGTMYPEFSQGEYFNFGKIRHGAHDFRVILQLAQITPGNDYMPEIILATLRTATGFISIIRCSIRDPRFKRGSQTTIEDVTNTLLPLPLFTPLIYGNGKMGSTSTSTWALPAVATATRVAQQATATWRVAKGPSRTELYQIGTCFTSDGEHMIDCPTRANDALACPPGRLVHYPAASM
ncbi:Unknown protein [Striga hermonthica]|uniref:Uncharacterized protein n=1 Tax=Striga hermonthica TaxID=68872 RepID=A0A9N7N699_STRHE|nr:Unknown protein [Striga hermonthica]